MCVREFAVHSWCLIVAKKKLFDFARNECGKTFVATTTTKFHTSCECFCCYFSFNIHRRMCVISLIFSLFILNCCIRSTFLTLDDFNCLCMNFVCLIEFRFTQLSLPMPIPTVIIVYNILFFMLFRHTRRADLSNFPLYNVHCTVYTVYAIHKEVCMSVRISVTDTFLRHLCADGTKAYYYFLFIKIIFDAE